jgi:hypothetical protein
MLKYNIFPSRFRDHNFVDTSHFTYACYKTLPYETHPPVVRRLGCWSLFPSCTQALERYSRDTKVCIPCGGASGRPDSPLALTYLETSWWRHSQILDLCFQKIQIPVQNPNAVSFHARYTPRSVTACLRDTADRSPGVVMLSVPLKYP